MRAFSVIAATVLIAGCADGGERSPRSREASHAEACVIAGNQCVKNIGDQAGCRASQAMCLAMAAQTASEPQGAKPTDAELRRMARIIEDSAPPLGPTDEQPDNQSDPATIAGCVSRARDLVESKLDGHIDRTLVTYSPRWGAVWRADFTFSADGQTTTQRYVCTRSAFVVAPLKMFDPSQDTAPLPER